MAEIRQHNGIETWTIHSEEGSGTATFIPELGGIGSSFVLPGPDGPRELLYQHEFFWDRETTETRGASPFLFPICGRMEHEGIYGDYAWNGRTHNMAIHGFALNMPWEAASEADDRLVLTLTDNEQTRVQYPFSFRVELDYRVADGELTCRMTVTNRSTEPMPYFAGFHPYLLTAGVGEGKERTQVDIEPEQRLLYNEALTAIVDEAPPASFPNAITDPAINEMHHRLGRNKETRLRHPDGFTVHMDVTGDDDPDLFSYLQLYTMADQPFFCIEPWMGYPNMLNEPENVHTLAPGATERAIWRIWTSWLKR